jgi:hypothetical protein
MSLINACIVLNYSVNCVVMHKINSYQWYDVEAVTDGLCHFVYYVKHIKFLLHMSCLMEKTWFIYWYQGGVGIKTCIYYHSFSDILSTSSSKYPLKNWLHIIFVRINFLRKNI